MKKQKKYNIPPVGGRHYGHKYTSSNKYPKLFCPGCRTTKDNKPGKNKFWCPNCKKHSFQEVNNVQ